MIHIVLYRPELAANTGNIMRTAAAIGAKLHLVGPFAFSLFDREVKRAALDYGNMLDVMTYHNFEEFLTKNRHPDTYMITRYGSRLYSDVNFVDKSVLFLMFGSESSGIPLEILKNNVDRNLRIPMQPAARSLNLSNSVAIVAYEVLRQKKFENLALQETLKGADYL